MDGQVCQIKISPEGKLQFYNMDSLLEMFKLNPNFHGFIKFHRFGNDFESLHKIYYWWVDLIADHVGDSRMNIDNDLSQLFLSYNKFNALSKKTVTLVKSKDDLTYKEWLVFLRDINFLCMKELGFAKKDGESTLPIPNNLKGKI